MYDNIKNFTEDFHFSSHIMYVDELSIEIYKACAQMIKISFSGWINICKIYISFDPAPSLNRIEIQQLVRSFYWIMNWSILIHSG